MASSSAAIASTSRWFVGSSRRRTLHGVRQKVASATRAFSPPDRSPIDRAALSPTRPRAPMTALHRSSVTVPSVRRTVCETYSNATTSCGSSCARSCANTPSSSRSSATRCPSPRRNDPARAFRIVDLPAPFGPRKISRMPFATARSAPVMMSCAPSGWRMSAPASANGVMPHGGGAASVSEGRRCWPISSAFAAACCFASLSSLPCRSLACVALDAFAPMRSIKSCMRLRSRSCASTVARTRACRSSRSSRNLSYVTDLYSSSRPPATSAMLLDARRRNSASWETTSTVPWYAPT
mmetsp:Transcript_20585/g.60736  ORF Transcript_20585/g.60736 Transcript_20585/m.60736 type:complete len:296 (+) Transcript_20585:1764-2651(+)